MTSHNSRGASIFTRGTTLALFTLAALILCNFRPALAQEGSGAMTITPPARFWTLGPMFTAGGSVSSGNVATGTKTDVRFAWTFGALGFIPFTPDVAAGLGLAYDARGVNFHQQDAADKGINTTLNYLSIQPQVRLSSFTAGLGFGIPLGATATPVSGSTASTSIDADKMNMMIEVRVGGAIPLVRAEGGDLRLLINAAYPFTQIFTNTVTGNLNNGVPSRLTSSTKNDENNGPVPTLQLGLTYQFNVSAISPN